MRFIKSFKQSLIHEASIKSLSRIWQHTNESNIGVITAFRGEYDQKTNEARNRDLMSEIRSAGFGYTQVTGFYIENLGQPDEKKVQEKSMLITSHQNDAGKLKTFLVRMGIKYNQDSVFYKPAGDQSAILIGTTDGRWPGKGVEFSVGKFHPQKMGQYYTKMKGNRTFTFESVEFPENLMTRAYRERSEKGAI